MLLVILSWFWIGLTAFLCGFGILQLLHNKDSNTFVSLDYYVFFGLSFLTVYSQTFSLFYKVGKFATILLGIFCIIVIFIYHRRLFEYFKELGRRIGWKRVLLCAIIILIMVYFTCGQVFQYDTDLYHAQFIRWIEEYGVVKGLGNLHNRFAYNSAFFPLQALYSFSFLLNRSLHTLNGFVAAILLCYSIGTLRWWRGNKLAVSDMFKLALSVYLFLPDTLLSISSPGSDILTLAMVLYIASRWAMLIEENCTEAFEYGLLCLLAVWAVTLKLSAGLLVLLAVYPAVLLIKQKRYKQMIALIISGIVIVVPFLTRNIFISGYLLYPYSSIDLFSVDWKMLSSVASNDSIEIMAWGRGIKNFASYESPISVWMPIWYDKLSLIYQVLVWLNAFCILITLGSFPKLVKRKKWGMVTLMAVCLLSLLMWWLTSPLVRYGVVYMMLLPAIWLGMIFKKRTGKGFSAILFIFCICSIWKVSSYIEVPHWKWPMDYNWRENTIVNWQDIYINIPIGSDCIGYHFFPSSPNEERLELIELRTNRLEDGFKVKEIYQGKNVLTNGSIIE